MGARYTTYERVLLAADGNERGRTKNEKGLEMENPGREVEPESRTVNREAVASPVEPQASVPIVAPISVVNASASASS